MVSCSTTLFRCKCLGGLRVLYNNTGNTLLIEEMGYHSSARGRCTYYVLGSVRPINCPIRIACIWKVITTVVCSCWRNGRQSGSECHGDAKPLAPYSSVPPWPLDPPPNKRHSSHSCSKDTLHAFPDQDPLTKVAPDPTVKSSAAVDLLVTCTSVDERLSYGNPYFLTFGNCNT